MTVSSTGRYMDCKDVKKRIHSYIAGKLGYEETEEFLEHIETCSLCKDELEIYYTIEACLMRQEEPGRSFHIKEELENQIQAKKVMLERVKLQRIFYYTLNTLIVWSIIISLLLRLRIWFSGGYV